MAGLQKFRAELHVHTVVSPCAEVEMIPPLIVQQALQNQIDLIAITDHNSTANVESVMKAAQGSGLTVLAGMELQTIEEVHSLCIFPDLERALAFQKIVDKALPLLPNAPEHLGEQFIVDETGEFIRREERLLIISTDLSLTDAWETVTSLDGLLIPAHVNRKAFGLLENLGFVPTDIPLQTLEISRHLNSHQAVATFPQLDGYTLIKGGDVHHLDEFLGANVFTLEKRSLEELKLALVSFDGRSVVIND
jgi:3',5'-nucleoside bisphosphate phosphatase